MKLHSSPKTYYKGTHRIISPIETKRNVLKRVKCSKLPVFQKAFRIDSLDKIGLPVYAVTHNNKFKNCRLPSWGKGLTEDLAYVSGIMERAERYSSSDAKARKEEIIYSDFISIKKEGAISKWDLIPCNLQRKLYSEKEINTQVRPWTRCFWVNRDKDVFIPANLVFFKADWCRHDFSESTGLASGNNFEEAIQHALCEIIERHLQDTIHWNKKLVPTIDIDSVSDGELRKIINRMKNKGIELHLSYFTDEFKIPAIRIFAYDTDGYYFDSFGFYSALGVHLDKNIALARALIEFAQARVTLQYRRKNGLDEIRKTKVFPQAVSGFFRDVIDNQTIVSFDKINSYITEDFLEDIKLIKGILIQKGCDIFIKDLTHPDLGIPTVRVIVKGLQPGVFGIGITDLNHKVARISPHLQYYSYLISNIQNISLAG